MSSWYQARSAWLQCYKTCEYAITTTIFKIIELTYPSFDYKHEAMRRTHEDIQDELLVLQCQEGNDQALKALIARWHPRFVRLAWRLTAQQDVAQDITQDAWLVIVRKLNRLDDPTRFQSWSYRIISNKCTDWIRRRVTHRQVTHNLKNNATDNEHAPSDQGASQDAVTLIRDALSQLPDDQRTILSLHYLDEMQVVQIARILDIPSGTVKSRLHHARNRLKNVLERIDS